ncbi:MAG: oligosaccharide flippase family protein [Saprospiraceae bacterium]|nr:oligosaccharide flippase family protein [Saprospiraceae bacterium]
MLFYTFLGFIRPALAVILLPIYLSVFSKNEWAIYSLMLVVGNFSMIILTWRINAAMLTKYFDYYHDRNTLRRYLRSIFSASIVIGVIMIVLSYFIGPLIFDLIFKSEEILFFPYGFTILIYAVLSEINISYFIFLKNERNLRKYALVVITQVLLVIFLQFLLIVVLKEGVQGAVLGMLLANVITFIMILFLEKDIITFRPDMQMVRKSLVFSIPLIPYLMIYWFMTKGERIFIEQFMDLASVGTYILLVTFTGVTVLFIEATINGVRPFLFELFTRNARDDNKAIQLLTRLIVNTPLLALPLVIFVGSNINLITTNKDYYEIIPFVSFAAVVAYTLVYGKMFYQHLVYRKKSFMVTALSFISLVVFVFALIKLVPWLGVSGVLWSVLIVNIVFGVLFYIAGQKAIYVDYNYKDILGIPLVCVGLIFLVEYLCIHNGMSYGLYGLVQFFVVTSVVFLLNRSSISEYRHIFMNSKS